MGPRQRKWLEDLRSGKFPQGRLSLCNDRGCHCCLGVAVRSLNSLGLKINGFISDKFIELKWVGYNTTTSLPWDVCEMLGLTIKGRAHCVLMNDEKMMTFKEIADYIESHESEFFDKEL